MLFITTIKTTKIEEMVQIRIKNFLWLLKFYEDLSANFVFTGFVCYTNELISRSPS